MSAAIYPRIADPADFGRVAVLLGGNSAEREISLLSGEAVLEALNRQGVEAHAVDPINGLIEQFAAVHFDQALGDAEPKTCTWYVTHMRVVSSEELSEQHLLIFRRDSHTGIAYTNGQAIR